jgi:hypothetical protein
MPRRARISSRGSAGDFSKVRIHTDEPAAASAQAVDALAYTVDRHIVFGSGLYRPHDPAGRKLLAHELAHVVQEGQSGVLRRQPRHPGAECPGDTPPGIFEGAGQALASAGRGAGAPVYRYFGRWREGDSESSFRERATRAWVRWRFGARPEGDRERVVATMLGLQRQNRNPALRPGCYYYINLDHAALATARAASGEARARRAPPPAAHDTSTGVETPQEAAVAAPVGRQDPANAISTATSDAEPGAPEHAFAGDVEHMHPDWSVLQENEPLAQRYLLHMEHFAGLTLTPRLRALAAGGLTATELHQIIGDSRRLATTTNRYTQAFAEYRAAGGTEVNGFAPLIELILEQLSWGNPTAARNLLEIGRGESWVREERGVIGIRHRRERWLLYDAMGAPLRSISGQMFRDDGYVAARPPESGLNIAAIEDPALRGMLNMLRQRLGDPNRVIVQAAEAFYRHANRLRPRVMRGLGAEVIQRFEEMLAPFIVFLSLHGLSTLLLRAAHPTMVAIGAALRGLLAAAGYLMQIDFTAGAVERLFAAARPLSRVREETDGRLTQLSEHYLDEAATPIRSIVADIAVMATASAMGRLIRALRGRGRAQIACTQCNVTELIERSRTQTPEEAHAALAQAREPLAARRTELAGERTRIERSVPGTEARITELRRQLGQRRQGETPHGFETRVRKTRRQIDALRQGLQDRADRNRALAPELERLNRDLNRIDTEIRRTEALAIRRDPMADLARERIRRGLPVAGTPSDESTLSRLDIEGRSYYGANGADWEAVPRRELTRVNHYTVRHAEGCGGPGIGRRSGRAWRPGGLAARSRPV